MNIDIFAEVKRRVPIADICAAHGIKIKNRSGSKLFAICPFHNEKPASLVVYVDTNSFNCFSCGASGSVIDFISQLYNLTPLDSAKKLNEDFNLGLEAGQPPDKAEIKEAVNDRKLLDNFETWISTAYTTLCDYSHLLGSFKEQYTPKTPDEAYSNLFIEALHNSDYVEWLIDGLIFADFETQIDFYKIYKKEVENIAVRVEQYRKNNNAKNTA